MSTKSLFGVRLLFALILVPTLLLSFRTVAQTQLGTIYGRVFDKSGGVVADAKLALTNTATHVASEGATALDGSYIFAGLTPGSYELTAEKSGFASVLQIITVEVAQRLTIDLHFELSGQQTVVEVSANTTMINTTSGEVSKEISSRELETLPLITRNPYALIGLAAGAVDTAASNGDFFGQGFAVNGQRTRSINFLLDGAENNETFSTGPAVAVPTDAVQEFRVQTNSMTAEFGRNAVITNVVVKAGTDSFHGAASEFYRGAGLTTNTFQNKANGITSTPNFVRNDFTGSIGGPIRKDKTFFFGALEGVRVRSSGVSFWWVPTQDFLSHSSPKMAAYLTAAGPLPASNPNNCISAINFAATQNVSPLNDANTGQRIPGATSLFCQAATSTPIDAGGGVAGDTWNAITRIDHRLSGNTNLMGRFAFSDVKSPAGVGSDTPYVQFRTPLSLRSQNYSATLTHSFSPRLFNESRLAFSRTFPNAPLGKGDVNIPCLQYQNLTSTPDGNPLVFPGYLPAACATFSLPSGGPQNTITGSSGFTLSRGKNTFKWGLYASHLRDNHTFGALQNAGGKISNPQNLLNGIIDTSFTLAYDPRGRFPGDTYNPTVDGPFVAPIFTRHYRYNETALYGEDSLRVTSRLTMDLGLRWEYFGVLHSPDGEKFLDANLFLDAIGQSKAQNSTKTIYEQVRDARFSRTNNLYNANWHNFSPRVGLAWDMFGNGRTVFRGGYGIFYDKNFGNALFNAIQNFPNYAVASLSAPFPNGTSSGAVDPNQYVVLQNLFGPGAVTLTGSARMLNRDMVTAYSQQWDAVLEHNLFGKGLIASFTYVGTKGDKLYSLNNLNMRGSCILAPVGSEPCNPGGGNSSRLNQSGITGMNRRANEGFSRYHGFSGELKTRSYHGFVVDSAYTYAHSMDNSSSFFADSAFDGDLGEFGFRQPFQPSLDYGDSSNDIKHKYSLSFIWEIPLGQKDLGWSSQLLGGWSVSGIFVAQTGGAFSVYNLSPDSQCARSTTNFCYPVQVGAIPRMQDTSTGAPNTFTLYDLTGVFQSQGAFCAGDLACTANLDLLNPGKLEKRNLFRLPGYWNGDAAVSKKFRLPSERMRLELRVEGFNFFNHSNLYANIQTNFIENGQVTANRGVHPGIGANGIAADRRAIQLGAKLTF
jgi:hypothetical protein